MNHADLVKMAKKWLWQYCPVVVTEMSVTIGEIPDAIGWSYRGYSIVIECKATRADFLADKRKASRKKDEDGIGNEKYYLAPKGIIKPEELLEGWGLLEYVDKKRRPKTIRYPILKESINQSREIFLLLSCLRRIGGLRDGISVKCYQFHSKNRATLGIKETPK